MNDNPVTVDIVSPETAMISVDISCQYSLSVDICFDESQPVTDLSTVCIDITSGLEEVNVPAASSYGGISLDLIYGGIKGDKGDPGGSFVTRVVSGAIGGHRVVIQNPDGVTVSYADSNNPDHAGVVAGITKHAADSGVVVEVQVTDIMTEPSWSWIPFMPVYLGSNGTLTQNEAHTGVFILIVGVALTSTSMMIRIQQPVFK